MSSSDASLTASSDASAAERHHVRFGFDNTYARMPERYLPEGFDLTEENEWYLPTIRRGEWPRYSEAAIQRLWHKCVELSQETAEHRARRGKLSTAAGPVIIGSCVIPLLLAALRLVNMGQFYTLWHYGKYFAAAGLGALIADWWTSD